MKLPQFPASLVSKLKKDAFQRKPITLETMENRVLFDAAPVVTLDAPGSIQVGETVDVSVAFDNVPQNPGTGETGFGPWVDIFIDTTGTDGIVDPLDPSNNQTGDLDGVGPGDEYDGISFVGTPSYLGTDLNFTIITLDDTANGGLGVEHPYAVDTNGDPVYVSTTVGPYAATLGGSYATGDQLMVIELPFGSFAEDQPRAEIDFQLSLSDKADIGQSLSVTALGGFRFGQDARDNPSSDPSTIGTADATSVSTSTTLAQLNKEYQGPENETATGINFQRTYRININIAAGQTLSDVNIFDELPDQLQYVSVNASQAFTVESAPSTLTAGGDLHVSFDGPIVGGVGSADAWVDVTFYVPRVDGSNNPILNASSANDVLVDNQAYGFGSWDPIDPRDSDVYVGFDVNGAFDGTDGASALATAAPDADAEHENLELAALTIQKSSSTAINTGVLQASPGDVVEYVLNFQVSDYFAFEDLVVSDILSDGLRFDSGFTPTLLLNGNTYTLGAAGWTAANYTVSQNFTGATASGNQTIDPAANDGTTTINFRISDEMVTRGRPDGKLLGGGVDPADPAAAIANDLSTYNDGPTTGRIVYRAIIQDSFTDDFPSGEASVNPRDELQNTVTITGDVLDLTSGAVLNPTGQSESDGSSNRIRIFNDDVKTFIYAINDIERLSDPSDLDSAENALFTTSFRTDGLVTGALNLQPGDKVTYRILYDLPTGDVEDLRVTDFFPLPVFDVDDPDANGADSIFSFVDNLTTGETPATVTSPATGVITYGPSHNLHTVTTPGVTTPTIVVNSNSNALRLEWGDFINSANDAKVLDVLISVTVSDAPFADNLSLTNQVQSGEQNTQNPGIENEANTNAVIQITLNQPDVDIYKGVVASTEGGPVGAVGGITFDAIGAGSDSFTGTLDSSADAQAIGALDLTAGTLPDGGDQVRFALIAQNTGRSDAFDVTITDTLVGSYENNYASTGDFLAGTNFNILRGDGGGSLTGAEVDQFVKAASTADVSSFTGTSNLIDGVSLEDGDLVLLKDQSSVAENGVYVVSNVDDSAGTMDLALIVGASTAVAVAGGDTNLNTRYTGTVGGAWSLDAGSAGYDYFVRYDNSTKAFTVTLSDNYSAGNLAGDTKAGSLSRGFNSATGSDVANGSNAVVVLYDLTIDVDADASSTVTNTATLTNFAGADGALDHTSNDKIESASVVISSPEFEKELVDTEVVTATNANDEAVIGEYVTYRLTVTVPEGETLNSQIVDTLDSGLSFVEVVSVTTSTDVSTENTIGTGAGSGAGIGPSNITLADVGSGTANRLTFDLGTITNTNTNNASSDTVVIVYRAVVVNTNTVPSSPGNQTGVTLDNEADFSWEWNNDPDDPGIANPEGTDTLSDSAPIVTIIEPVLSVATTASTDGGSNYSSTAGNADADDSVSYRIRITNAAGGPTAFDIDLSNAFDGKLNGLTIDSVTLTSASGGVGGGVTITDGGANTLDVGDFDISGSTLSLAGGRNLDIAADSRLEIIVSATLDISVNPNESIDSVTTIGWTSLDGTPGQSSIHAASSVERTNADGEGTDIAVLNNYVDTNTGSIEIDNVVVVSKTVESTSEAHTAGSDVTIGEVIRYRVEIDIPEGTTLDFQVRDLLPNGLRFLNDGQAMVGFVSPSDNVSSSTPALSGAGLDLGAAVAAPTFVLPDEAVSTSPSSNSDTYNNGTDVYFKLGDIVNDADDPGAEKIVLEFNTIVHNSSTNRNDAGESISNRARAISDGVDLDTSSNVTVDVVEAEITTTKTVTSTGPYDGSNSVEYTVVFTNLNGADNTTAFDVVMQDDLPSFLGSASITSVTPSGTVTGIGSSVVGNLIEVTVDSMAVGASVTVVYTADLSATAPAGQLIENTAEVEWTSLPGSNGTASATPGVSGAVDGERDGSDGSGEPNDYQSSDDASITASTPTISKLFRDGTLDNGDTNQASTSGANVVIGETVTYDILVNLPEGLTQDLIVRDLVPDGLRIDSYEVILEKGTLNGESDALPGDWGGVGATDLVANSPSATATPFSGTGNFELDFGDVQTSSDNDVTNNAIVVRIVATVINDLDNVDGRVLTNSAQYTFTDPNDSSTVVVTETDATDTEVTVREPELEVVTSVTSNTTNLEGGDAITYQIVVQHTGDSSEDAFDIKLSDTFDSDVTLSLDSATISAPGDVTADFNFAAGVLTTTGNIDLLSGQTLTLTFSGSVNADAAAATGLSNNSLVTWSSFDGGLDGDDAGTADERTGTDGVPVGANTYSANDPLTVNLADVLNVSKVADKATATIGEIVTYTVTIEVADGTTTNLVLDDTLPTGMSYVSNSSSLPVTPGGWTINGFDTNSLDQTFTSIVNPGAADGAGVLGTGSFTYTYQVRVDNIAANQDGVVLTNDLDADADDVSPDDDNEADVTVIEPVLEIDQTFDTVTTGLDAGDTVTYRITVRHTGASTADAYELVVENTFPGDLETFSLDSAELDGVDVIGSFNLTAGGVLTTTGDIDLPQGDELVLVVSGIVEEAADVGATLTSAPTLVWSSLDGGLDGDDAGTLAERTGSDGELGSPNDYADSDSDSATLAGVLNVAKVADVATATIGEIVTYTVTFTVSEGETVIDWSDTLPAGMTLVANSVAIGTNTSALNITGLSDNTLTGQSLNVLSTASGDDAATAETASFTITYEARVDNVAGNQNNTVLTNDVDAAADLNDDGDTTDGGETVTDDTDVTVTEPVLNIDQSFVTSTAGLDAGDTVTYEIVVTHAGASTADAFELILGNTFPADLEGFTLDSAVISGVGGSNVIGSFAVDGNTGVLTTTGNVDLTQVQTLTLRVSATVEEAADVGATLTSSPTLVWSGADGGLAGDDAGSIAERTGSDGELGSPNDYADSDSDSATLAGVLNVAKVADVATANIGDIVTYTVTFTVGEGETDIDWSDTLPAGMTLVANSVAIGTNASALNITGLSDNTLTGQTLNVLSTASGDDAATAETASFTITYEARVDNVAGNQNNDVLTNDVDAAADLNDDGDTTDGGETATDDADVTVTEPVLEIDQTFDTVTTGLDAGDTVTYRITVRHTGASNADAYELVVENTFPGDLETFSLDSAELDGVNVIGSFNLTAGGVLTTTGDIDLPQGDELVLVVSGVIEEGANVGATLTSSPTLLWSGADGGLAGDDAGTLAERTGSDGELGSPNDYADSDSDSATLAGVLNVAKVADVATANIGDIVTYTVTFTVGEGETDIDWSDTLPAGMTLVANSVAIGTNASALNITGLNDNTLTGQTLNVLSTSSGDDAATAETASFTITYEARVDNVAGNQNNTVLTNDVDAAADLNDDGDTTDGGETVTDDTDVTVTEPVLNIDQSFVTSTAGLDAGDTVTYEIVVTHAGASTADAFELILGNTFPADLEGFTLDSAVISGVGGSNVIGSFAVDGNTGVLTTTGNVDLTQVQTLTLRVSATVEEAADVGATLTSSPTLVWSGADGGLAGDDAGSIAERTGSDGELGSPNDYADSDSDSATLAGVLNVAKVADVATANIGDIVTYTVTFTVGEGETDIDWSDTLPAGMTLVANSVAIGTNASALNITGLSDNTLTGQTLNVLSTASGDDAATAETASFTITYEARVDNVAGNQNNDVLTNDVDAAADLNDDGDTTDGGETATDDADVTVTEPVLEIDQTFDTVTTGLDAGDTVTYRITVRHTGASNADAYELVVENTFPGDLETFSLDSAELDGVNVIGSFNLTAGGVLTTTGDIDLPQGDELVLVVSGVIEEGANVGATLTSSPTLLWSGADGGLAGDDAGTLAERTGSDGELGSPNDYADSDSDSATLAGVLNVAKVADVATATIGEIVTYTVTFTVSEGETVIDWSDTLPAGMTLVANSVAIGTNASALNITGLNDNTLTGQTLNVLSTSSGDDAATAETASFTITYEARVDNVAGNQNNTVLTNDVDAAADLNDDGDTTDGGETVTDDTDVTVTEPVLEIDQTFDTVTTGLDAGDTVTYRITVRHTGASSADAYELVVENTFPGDLETFSLDSAELDGVDVIGSFNLTAGGVLTTTGDIDLPQGDELVLVVSGVIEEGANVGATLTSSPALVWSGADGGLAGDDAGSISERTGSDGELGSPNDYADSDSDSATLAGVLNVAKVADVATATIGEIVTYTVTFTVSEGETVIDWSDTLPAGMTLVANSVAIGTNTSALNITGLSDNTLTGQSLNVLSTASGDDAATAETASFTITYEARVDNVVGNQDGVDLTNALVAVADLNDDSDTGDAGESQSDDDTVTVTEPVLTIAQDFVTSTAGLDAGDTVTYEIVVTHDGASTADAFELILGNTFPADLEGFTLDSAVISGVGGSNVIGSFAVDGNTGVLTTTGNVDLTQVQTLTLRVSATVEEAADVGATLTSSPTLVWSSQDGGLDGDEAGTLAERTGSDGELGSPNNYEDSDSDSATLAGVLNVAKASDVATASVGEIVTYTVTFTVSEGETVIDWSDTLPSGMTLVANSVAIGANTSSLNITGLNDNTLTGQTLNVVGTASADDAATAETAEFTIVYEALVENVAGNQDGTVLTNDVDAAADLNDDGDSTDGGETVTDDTDVTVTEPVLDVSKSVTTADTSAVDAGDVLTYEIEVTHTGASTADAYEVTLADNLPSELGSYSLDSALITGPGGSDVSGSFSINGSGVLSTTGDVDLLQGQTLTLQISGTVLDSNVPGTDIDNSVALDWSSADGGQRGDEAGISDGVDDERTGTAGSGLDDYNASDSAATVTTVGTLAVTKTSDVATAAIGDTITYTVQVTVAEGTTTVDLSDTLPAGTSFVATTASLSTPAGWTITGFDTDSVDQTLTITNPGDVDAAGTLDSDSFTYSYEVLVENVAGNQDGVDLTNALVAVADLNDDSDTGDAGESQSDDDTVTVTEPVLEIDQTFDTVTTGLDAGDTVTYRITIRHTGASTADAYELVVENTFPGDLETFSLDSAELDGVDVSGSFNLTAGGVLTTTGDVDLPEGEELVLVVSGVVEEGADVGATLTSSPTLVWSSQDGGLDGDEAGTLAERTGSDGELGSPNDYADSDSDSATLAGVLNVAKASDVATASVGEIVTYTVTFTVSEGETVIDWSDTLPSGMTLVANSVAIGANTSSLNITGLNDNTLIGQTLNVVGTASADDAATAETAEFTIVYEALVENVAGNQDGTVLTNGVDAAADLNDDGDSTDGGETVTDDTDVTVTEPVLNVSKSVTTADTSAVDAGDVLTYEIVVTHTGASTADAYEVTLADNLPSELGSYSLDSALITGPGGSDVSGSFSINGSGVLSTTGDVDLLQGQTLTLQISGTVLDSNVPGTDIDNSVALDWSSADGGQRGDEAGISDGVDDERTGTAGSGLDDYNASDSAATVTTVGTLAVTKTSDVATAAIGDTITYTVQVTVAEGTTTVDLSDTLPAGTSFVATTASLSTPAGWTITGFDTDSVDQTLVITNPGDVDAAGALDSDSFTYSYEVLVENVVGNQDGVDLTNALVAVADLNDDSDTGDAGESQSDDDTVTVTEPVLTIAQDFVTSTAGLDAGDTVTYEIVVTHDGASTADAFELILGNTFPADLEGFTLDSAVISGVGGSNVIGSFAVDGNTGVLTTTGNVDLTQVQTLTLRVSATVEEAADVGATLTSSPTLVWSSQDGGLDGDEAGTLAERTGSDGELGSPNNYEDSDSDSATLAGVLNVAKASDVATASVGEIVTYTVTFTVSEGETVIDWSDTLPSGMTLVANSVAIGANTSSLNITGLNDNTLTGQTLNVVGTASADDAATAETAEFTIVYEALVENVAGNQDGTVLTNDVDAAADLNDDGDSTDGGETVTDDTDVTVTEPVLDVSKSVTTADTSAVDAGDVLTYEIEVTHTGASTADAYEVTLADNLPSELGSYSLDSALITGPGGSDVSGSFSINGSGVLSTTGDVDLLQGQTLTLQISGTVLDSNVPGTDIDNSVALDWSSADGGQRGDEAGISDGVDDERTGTAGSGLDDYNASDSAATVTTVGTLAVTKTSDVATAAIGDTITYTVQVTVAEGTTTVDLSDTLPAGTSFVATTASLSTPAGWTITGFDTDSVDQTLVITNPGDVDAAGALDSDSFTYSYEVLVENVVGNQDGVDLTNALVAVADLNDDSDTGDAGESQSDDDTVTVTEPVLTIAQDFVTSTAGLDAGDTVTYEIVVTHDGASTADAFELILSNTFPADLEGFTLDSAVISGVGGSNVIGSFAVDGNTGVLTTTGNVDLTQAQTLTLRVSATVEEGADVGATLTSSPTLVWSSQDGGLDGDEAGTLAERTGSDGELGSPNNYADSDSDSATLAGVLNVAKASDVATATIGEIVTYTVTFTVTEGNTVVNWSDTLPGDMSLIAGSVALVPNAANPTISGLNDNTLSGQVLTISGNNSGDDAASAETDTFQITYQARVTNVIGNQGGTILTNDVDASADLNDDGDNTDGGETVTDDTDVTVVEPSIIINKTASDTEPRLGETITYTIDILNEDTANGATAYDLTVTDTIPVGKLTSLSSLIVEQFSMNNSAATGDDVSAGILTAGVDYTVLGSSATGFTLQFASLAEDTRLSISYDAEVNSDPSSVLGTSAIYGGIGAESDAFTNTVSIDWSSISGVDANERTGADGAVGPLNDYVNSSSETVTVTGADLVVTKVDGGAVAIPGGQVSYTVTVTNQGSGIANDVVVTDQLPLQGVSFNAGASTVGSDTSVADQVTWNFATIAPGASETITVVVDIDNPAPVGLEAITNSVEVSYNEVTSGEDPTDEASDPTDNNDDLESTPLTATPIFVVIKDNTDPDDIIEAGDMVTYTISVQNTGDQNAIVDIRDAFPGNVLDLGNAVISMANGVTGETTTFPGDIFWDDVSLDAGATINITITAPSFNPGPAAVTDFDNVVTVSDTTNEVPDQTDTDTINLASVPDIKVTKTNSVDRIGPNESFTYTLVVENIGLQNGENVVVVDTLPDFLVFESATNGGIYDPVARTITWNSVTTPELALVSGSGTDVITFEINVNLPIGGIFSGELTNVATAADDGTNGLDPDLSNNTSEVSTEVLVFIYDQFNDATDRGEDVSYNWGRPIEVYREALVPIAPIYSGAAERGSTIELKLFNANGEVIGRQSVVVDTGGNWMASFPGTVLKDYPQNVEITQTPSSNSAGQEYGFNLRPYYAPAVNTGHFFYERITPARVSSGMASFVTGSLYESLINPVGFGLGKYEYESLVEAGIPTGR